MAAPTSSSLEREPAQRLCADKNLDSIGRCSGNVAITTGTSRLRCADGRGPVDGVTAGERQLGTHAVSHGSWPPRTPASPIRLRLAPLAAAGQAPLARRHGAGLVSDSRAIPQALSEPPPCEVRSRTISAFHPDNCDKSLRDKLDSGVKK
jgi:hypothetical protein